MVGYAAMIQEHSPLGFVLGSKMPGGVLRIPDQVALRAIPDRCGTKARSWSGKISRRVKHAHIEGRRGGRRLVPSPAPSQPATDPRGGRDLGDAVTGYRFALEQLGTAAANGESSAVLSALVARDHVAWVLAWAASVEPGELLSIAELDRYLESVARTITDLVGRDVLAGWRSTREPAIGAWWWSLDERASPSDPSPIPVWAVLSGLLLMVSLSLTAEIAAPFERWTRLRRSA
jgi:hypothetical protein